MKHLHYFLFLGIFCLTSCYKEEHEIVKALSGKYTCQTWNYSLANNSQVADTTIVVIDIMDIPLYPRKFRTVVQGDKIVCSLNFDNLHFDYEKENGLKMHGSFIQPDSISFSTTYGDCSGCGISGRRYSGVKM